MCRRCGQRRVRHRAAAPRQPVINKLGDDEIVVTTEYGVPRLWQRKIAHDLDAMTASNHDKTLTAAPPGQPVINGVPRRWQKKMIEHDLDVMTVSIHDLVDFCDRAEAIATDDGQTQKLSHKIPTPPRKARSATSALATATKGTAGMQPKPMIKALIIQLNVSQMNFMLHPLKIASVAINLSAKNRKNRWCQ